MSKQQHPPVTDPDNIPEVFCDGQMNVAIRGNLATITFTHRASAACSACWWSNCSLTSLVACPEP